MRVRGAARRVDPTLIQEEQDVVRRAAEERLLQRGRPAGARVQTPGSGILRVHRKTESRRGPRVPGARGFHAPDVIKRHQIDRASDRHGLVGRVRDDEVEGTGFRSEGGKRAGSEVDDAAVGRGANRDGHERRAVAASAAGHVSGGQRILVAEEHSPNPQHVGSPTDVVRRAGEVRDRLPPRDVVCGRQDGIAVVELSRARLPDDPHKLLDAGADRLLRLGNERLLFCDSRGRIEEAVDSDDQPEQDRGRDHHLDEREAGWTAPAQPSWRWHREIGHKRTGSCCAVQEKDRPSDARRPSRA